MEVYVGTSGYQYDFWRGSLYPEKCKKEDMLAAYAEHFRTVEVNNTFYARLREDDYDEAALKAWSAALSQEWERLFVFFKHEETAPTNAKAFADRFSA